MKEKFTKWNPSVRSKSLLVTIENILNEYRAQGYRLTLRQLYYQLVSRDIIPNKVSEYNSLGNVVSRGRLSGFIDWDMIEDRTRTPSANQHWYNPKQILDAAANSYYRSRWEDQKNHVEVWCEKDAVSNILQPVCSKWDVLFMANRGYSSQSAMYEAYKRLNEKNEEGKDITILYFGDHDPSGIDMIRDIADRLGTFLFIGTLDSVMPIALTMEQVREHNPPENPAKVTDSRYQSYAAQYGTSSWELDALEPSMLSEIVEEAILQYVDLKEFKKVEKLENNHKKKLLSLADKL